MAFCRIFSFLQRIMRRCHSAEDAANFDLFQFTLLYSKSSCFCNSLGKSNFKHKRTCNTWRQILISKLKVMPLFIKGVLSLFLLFAPIMIGNQSQCKLCEKRKCNINFIMQCYRGCYHFWLSINKLVGCSSLKNDSNYFSSFYLSVDV